MHEQPVRDLARARELAAGDLDQAIAAVREPLDRYLRLTAQVEAQLHVDLRRPVDTLIARHLAEAQLTPWLEQKLSGAAVELRIYVEDQHERAGVKS